MDVLGAPGGSSAVARIATARVAAVCPYHSARAASARSSCSA